MLQTTLPVDRHYYDLFNSLVNIFIKDQFSLRYPESPLRINRRQHLKTSFSCLLDINAERSEVVKSKNFELSELRARDGEHAPDFRVGGSHAASHADKRALRSEWRLAGRFAAGHQGYLSDPAARSAGMRLIAFHEHILTQP